MRITMQFSLAVVIRGRAIMHHYRPMPFTMFEPPVHHTLLLVASAGSIYSDMQ